MGWNCDTLPTDFRSIGRELLNMRNAGFGEAEIATKTSPAKRNVKRTFLEFRLELGQSIRE